MPAGRALSFFAPIALLILPLPNQIRPASQAHIRALFQLCSGRNSLHLIYLYGEGVSVGVSPGGASLGVIWGPTHLS